MIVAESRSDGELFPATNKIRTESTSSNESSPVMDTHSIVRNLELETVQGIFQDYDLLETNEAVSCVVCGKNYKSKVCVKKHLWEHSVYWDLFDGLKKQQRVLSIQAALILAIKFNPSLSLLLVTQPSSQNKKKSDKFFSDKNSGMDNSSISSTQNIKERKRKLDVISNTSDHYTPKKSLCITPSTTNSTKFNLLTESL